MNDKFELFELPPTNKKELMSHFVDWSTDPSIKLSDINEFMKDINNIRRKFNGEYLVFTTSGYPTVLELFIDEQKNGNLRINPVIIMTGGEYLSDHLREELSNAYQ